jgi:hypothetical protein
VRVDAPLLRANEHEVEETDEQAKKDQIGESFHG